MSEFTIKRATRKGVIPLIGLYGESGCGKTMSALLLARGMAGPTGKVVMIDSESGRGSIYADVIPGGYDVIELRQPFSPARYLAALAAAEAEKPACIVLDSVSHEWEGAGGILDLHADAEEKSGRPGLHNWKSPKQEHSKFMLSLLQCSVPLIVCMRAKFKTRQSKDERGKTQIIRDDIISPVQAEDFIFEMTAHAEVLPNHSVKLTKCSHPALRECFPENIPLKIEHGEALARWCSMAGTVPVATPKPAASPDDLTELKRQLWVMCKPFAGTPLSVAKVETQLRTWKILADDRTMASLTVEELREILSKLEIQLNEK